VGLCLIASLMLIPPASARPRVITGTSGDDRLAGTIRADTIYAYGGDDRIRPRAGNDVIHCGGGFDVVLVRDLRDRYRNCERVRYSTRGRS
jgi:RTX calcium-binding nonapeptide repeat (4 copies)